MKADVDPRLDQILKTAPGKDLIAVRVYPHEQSEVEIIEAYLAEGRVASGEWRVAEGYISLVDTGSQIEQLAEHSAVKRIELDLAAVGESAENGLSGQPIDMGDVESPLSIPNDVIPADVDAFDIGRPIPLDQFEAAKEAAEIPDTDLVEANTDTEEE